ncbi:uncharacterized protein fip1l1a [Cyprinodon tularosa]|uniref:uncharacterized protein fip1l1a n=1 Tax=Cyprinodon tularosa TaxID=77115 RepID=UPI0018E1EA70|nr:uncharacterized protein fip1l1a [Cyprinodon tularosa]
MRPLEEKPWRRPGADISNYFNYGFDEESWRAYCAKQYKVQAFQRHITKVMRQQAEYEEAASRRSASGRPSQKFSRRKKAKCTRRRGRAGSRSKAEACLFGSNAAKYTQEAGGITHKKTNVANFDLHHSLNVNTLLPFVPPQSSSFQLYQPVSSSSMLGSGNTGNFDQPSTSSNADFVGRGRKPVERREHVKRRHRIGGVTGKKKQRDEKERAQRNIKD